MPILLIHLGYLAYDQETQKVYISNQEICREFDRAIHQVKRDDTISRVRVPQPIQSPHETSSMIHLWTLRFLS